MQFLYLLESIRCPFLDGLFSLVTELGGETLYMALAIAVYWCVSKGLGFLHTHHGFRRDDRQPVHEALLPHTAALGPGPGLHHRRVRASRGHGLFLPQRPHAERLLQLRLPGHVDEKGLARPLFCHSCAHRLFADVSRRAHAARRGRGLPAGARPHAGALPALPRHRGASAQDVRPSSPAWSP